MSGLPEDAKKWTEDAADGASDAMKDVKDWAEDKKDDFEKARAHEEGKAEGWAEAKKEELEEDADTYADDAGA